MMMTMTMMILLFMVMSQAKGDTYLTDQWRAEDWIDLSTAVRVCSQCWVLYIVVAFTVHAATVGFDPRS